MGSCEFDPLTQRTDTHAHTRTHTPNVHPGIHKVKPCYSLSSVYFTHMLSNTPLVHHSCFYKPYPASALLRVNTVEIKPFSDLHLCKINSFQFSPRWFTQTSRYNHPSKLWCKNPLTFNPNANSLSPATKSCLLWCL